MEQADRDRWYAFFTRDGENLVRFVRRHAHRISEMDAEDIVADVMLSLVSRFETNGPVENIAGYVYRAIRNRMVDYERKNAKTTSLDGMASEDGEFSFLETLAADNEEPFAEEERIARMHRLTEAIGKLEPRQRAILIATELKGKSFRELSQDWGEPIGTLLSRKSRAVKTLRQLLEKPETEFNNH